jgi:hypothetical protein
MRFAAFVILICLCPIAAFAGSGKGGTFPWDSQKSEELNRASSLRAAIIPEADRTAIAKAVAIRLGPDMADMESATGKKPEDIILDTRIKMVDLNGDGIPEVIAQIAGDYICSPTGNCPFLIFQKTEGGYKRILHKEFVQTFTIQPNRTNGYNDIITGQHGGAADSGLTLFRYSKGVYHKAGCEDASWRSADGDTDNELKEPRLTPCAK